jgi:hypothetical protein
MSNPGYNLAPLADYLALKFGDIYDYKFIDDDNGIEVQLWTPELAATVKQYLVHEVPDDKFAAFLNALSYEASRDSREDQAEDIVTRFQAWEVAHAFHSAAVRAVPTLDDLIGHLNTWLSADQQDDAADWLDTHATQAQLVELAEFTHHPELDPATPWYRPEPEGWYFTNNLSPQDLLHAWHQVAVSDNEAASATVPPSPPKVRAWARAHGHHVGARGPLPIALVREYQASFRTDRGGTHG